MFTDKSQIVKNNARSQRVKDLLGDKDYDQKSFTYFVDILNELGEAMDLARDYIDISGKDMNLEFVRNCYVRERAVGNILLADILRVDDREFVDSYIDSVCVEYSKFLYEVGLINFRTRVQDITNAITESSDYDYHDLLVSMARSYDKELKDVSQNEKSVDQTRLVAV
ncbi:MAG: hypothetical protein IIZ67_01385 [Bacilli bacterium]|nr:hypothetical protein [Bacilli bacterium]